PLCVSGCHEQREADDRGEAQPSQTHTRYPFPTHHLRLRRRPPQVEVCGEPTGVGPLNKPTAATVPALSAAGNGSLGIATEPPRLQRTARARSAARAAGQASE